MPKTQSEAPSQSRRIFFLRLAVAVFLCALIVAIRVVLDGDETARRAMLRNVDNGVILGNRTAEAIGDFFLKQGRYPSRLDDLPVKIDDTPMAHVALSRQGNEAVITLVNKRFRIDGRRMYFTAELRNGKMERIVCRTDDEEFRNRIEGRCE